MDVAHANSLKETALLVKHWNVLMLRLPFNNPGHRWHNESVVRVAVSVK